MIYRGDRFIAGFVGQVCVAVALCIDGKVIGSDLSGVRGVACKFRCGLFNRKGLGKRSVEISLSCDGNGSRTGVSDAGIGG